MKRYRVIPLHGEGTGARGEPINLDRREHGVQVGGSGGRIIGDGWGLGRSEAERLAHELQAAYQAGAEGGVEA